MDQKQARAGSCAVGAGGAEARSYAADAKGFGAACKLAVSFLFFLDLMFWKKKSLQAAGGSLRALRSFANSAREKGN